MLDAIDLKILQILQEDGRQSLAALGKAVDLTGPSVYARLQRMEREGVIRGYTALLNPERLGQGLVAFIRVTTHASADENQIFEQFVVGEPQILECHDIDGEDSYMLKVRTSSPQALRELLSRIRGVPSVTRTLTSIALFTIKDNGSSVHLGAPPPTVGEAD